MMGAEKKTTPNPNRAHAATPAHNGSPAPRSCYRCKERKVRCDKKTPCSPCRRGGSSCEYPPSGPRVRRSKKTMMAEMASRISSLEASAASTSGGGAAADHSEDRSPADALEGSPSGRPRQLPRERSRGDVLLRSGSSSQYFNEVFLSGVIKNERDIESIISTAPPQPPEPWNSSPFAAAGILSAPNPSIQPATLHPPQRLAVRLWNIYVSNAACCNGFELLHVPTDELKVCSTIDDPASAPYENLALSFAIYFTSVVSMDDLEARVVLRQDRTAMLLQLKTGLEQALAHGNFLDCPTMTGLYAYMLYLSVLRYQNRGKGLWILKGFAIRAAQALGLHRDGSRFGLSPFECEIRRRLWWHLLSRDRREGEDHGLENTNSLLLSSDVHLPRNVDDSELYPDMRELPEEKTSWTSLTFLRISIECAKAMLRLSAIAESSSPSSPPSEETRVKIVQETRDIVDKWYRGCNPVIPQQLLTLTYCRFLLRKLDFISKLQFTLSRHAGGDAVPPTDFATDENLIEALEILDPKTSWGDEMLRQFVWVSRAFPQYHVTMYVLWHLCIRPEGPIVERAWAAIEAVFSSEIYDGATIGLGSKLSVLTALRAKAMAVRAKANGVDQGSGSGGYFIETPRGDPPVSDYVIPSFCDGSGVDEFASNLNDGEWPNWSTLAQGFQLSGPGLLSL